MTGGVIRKDRRGQRLRLTAKYQRYILLSRTLGELTPTFVGLVRYAYKEKLHFGNFYFDGRIPRPQSVRRKEGSNMSSQVVRVERFTKGSLSAIGKEVERDEKDLFENRNEDIDRSRTHLNEFFKLTNNGMYNEWKETCERLNIVNANKLKKNVTAFEGMVITSDRAFFESLGWSPGEDPTVGMNDFFNQAYEFACREIGFRGTDENILSAAIHYDETTPHLQLYYIPVVDSWKEKVYEKDENERVKKSSTGSPIQARDEKGKIIYNRVTNSLDRRLNRSEFWQNKGGKNSYTRMQDRFQELVGKNFGLDRGEIGSTREHTTKQKWQKQQLDQQLEQTQKSIDAGDKFIGQKRQYLDQLRNDYDQTKISLQNTQNSLSEALAETKALQDGLPVLRAEKNSLNQEIAGLRLEKNELTRLKGDVEGLKLLKSSAQKELNEYYTKLDTAKKDLTDIEISLSEARTAEKDAKRSVEHLAEKKEILRVKIRDLEYAESRFPAEVKNLSQKKAGLEADLKILSGEKSGLQQENRNLKAENEKLYRFKSDRVNIMGMVDRIKDSLNDVVRQIERDYSKEVYIPRSTRKWANKKPGLFKDNDRIHKAGKELRQLERQQEKQNDEKERKLNAVDRLKQQLDRQTEPVMSAGDEYEQAWDDWEMDR